MRIKMKIAYHASAKRVSVLEHIITTMIKTYKEFHFDDFTGKSYGSSPTIRTGRSSTTLRRLGTFQDAEKERGYMILGSAFAPKLKGFAKLMTIRAKLVYGRLKFEKYLATEWEYGVNPCFKIPLDLQVASYP